ncbi:hypothetical protein [Methanosarcina acetivorans]|uniref:Uncharacterized protein n=1 Tax=Methanosarcina acetivorans (strain ATCC 35395 / DSM 2834 / JCM 12185 / C2A) TaxID=188937 RepID=Q8TPM1_METAC|nr:hypothetical protein [Methanosarcina acetivorans]AAM05291.1 predicted protein [Methanosarcina acetivorans C2A]
MNREFTDYLHNIGATGPIIDKAENAYKNCENICPEEIKGIFVSEYTEENGNRMYENLWFFSERYCMESKNFTQRDNIDITPYNKIIKRLFIEKKDYEFTEANAQSRAILHFVLHMGIDGTIKASGENCDHLLNIVKSYFIPNLLI